jgi:hypothetical protein
MADDCRRGKMRKARAGDYGAFLKRRRKSPEAGSKDQTDDRLLFAA